MKTLLSLVCLSFLTVSALVGCAGSTEDSTSGSSDLTASAAADKILAGACRVNGANATPYASITLKADHSFAAQGGCTPTAGAIVTCHAVIEYSGTWKIAKSGPELGAPAGAPQLVLTDVGDNVHIFFYAMKSDHLSLSTSLIGSGTSFDKDTSALPKLQLQDVCADTDDNSVGICPESTPCAVDGPKSDVSRCLPPI